MSNWVLIATVLKTELATITHNRSAPGGGAGVVKKLLEVRGAYAQLKQGSIF